MNFSPGDNERYQIPSEEAQVIQAFQVCKAFGWTLEQYRSNPAWWNIACYALLRTENRVESEKIEEAQNARTGT